MLTFVVLSGINCVPDDPKPLLIEETGPSDADTPPCDASVYPCGPYGTGECDTIEDLSFVPVNDPGRDVAGDDDHLSLSDLFEDEAVQGVLLFGTAGWCQFCSEEGVWLNSIYPTYQDLDGSGRRIEFIAVIFQDELSNAATPEYGEIYARRRGFPFPAVSDQAGAILRYFDPQGAPGNVFISRQDMEIQNVIQGYDQNDIQDQLDGLDGPSQCR